MPDESAVGAVKVKEDHNTLVLVSNEKIEASGLEEHLKKVSAETKEEIEEKNDIAKQYPGLALKNSDEIQLDLDFAEVNPKKTIIEDAQ
jgi:hypothetical protein